MKKKWDLFSKIILVAVLSSLFTYVVFTSEGVGVTGGGTGTANLTVTRIGSSPILNLIGDQTATAGTLFSKTITATDADDDTLTFSDNTTLFDIDSSTGIIEFTPSSGDVGTHYVKITVKDVILPFYPRTRPEPRKVE